MSYSDYLEDRINNAVCNNTALQIAQVYAKLHIGDPGEDCTANAAGETTRKAVSFAASSGGACLSDALVQWTNVSTAEVYSHISLWDAATSGNALGSGAMTATKSVSIGDTFDFPIGEISFSAA